MKSGAGGGGAGGGGHGHVGDGAVCFAVDGRVAGEGDDGVEDECYEVADRERAATERNRKRHRDTMRWLSKEHRIKPQSRRCSGGQEAHADRVTTVCDGCNNLE